MPSLIQPVARHQVKALKDDRTWWYYPNALFIAEPIAPNVAVVPVAFAATRQQADLRCSPRLPPPILKCQGHSGLESRVEFHAEFQADWP